MYEKILINNKEVIFTYKGESLDLMNPPDISNFHMYSLYYNFINNALCIYKINKSNKNIPVFWTIIENAEKLDRIPHPNSTLRRLNNNESYFIKLIDGADLPIEVPKPIDINSISCIRPDDTCVNDPKDSCCSTPYIIGESFRDIQLTDSYFSNITVSLSGLLPNKRYYYTIDNNFSNWPAKIHPYSGFLERSGPTNEQLELTANLELIFSYLAEDEVGNILVTAPTSDTSNIFTFLTLSLWEEGCDDKTLLADTINISCKNCLTSLPVFNSLNLDEFNSQSVSDCATIKFDNNNIVTASNKASLKLFYQDIDISKTYSYIISSNDANWPLSVSSNSGLLIPKEIYPSGNKLYGSGTINLELIFSNTYQEPYAGWSNLDYTLDENFNLKLINENIYANLEAKILTNNCSNTDKLMIFCDDCLEDNRYNCIKDVNVNINNTNEAYYPLHVQRPGAEVPIDIVCCSGDINLNISLTNICLEEEYLFKIDSYPTIDILPNSGSFFSSSNFFEIKTLAKLNDISETNIKCTVEHKNSNYAVSDDVILKCRYCEWQQVKLLNEIYDFRNYNEGTSRNNLIAGKSDGSLIFLAIPNGHVHRSQDYGINWTQLTQHGTKIWSSLAYAEDVDVLYATTGRVTERIGNDRDSLVSTSGEVLKYIDEGNTFQTISSIPAVSSNGLRDKTVYKSIDVSTNGQTIICAQVGSPSFHNSSSLNIIINLLVSTDAGSTFSSIPLYGTTNRLYDISNISLCDETNSNSNPIAAVSFSHNLRAGKSAVYEPNSIFSIIDQTKNYTGIQKYTDIRPPLLDKDAICSARFSKNGSLLLVYSNSLTSVVLISRNAGSSWDTNAFSLKPVIINNSAISYDGSTIVLVTNTNLIFKSNDYGENWIWEYTNFDSNNEGISTFLWNNESTNNISIISLNKYNNQYGINLYHCPLN